LARRIADELELNTVIWGKYSRNGADWVVSITVFLNQSTNQTLELELREASLNELLVSAVLELNDKLSARLSADFAPKWRKFAGSNEAWDELARVVTLAHANAPAAAREKVLRQILDKEPSFVPAGLNLAELLFSLERRKDLAEEARKLLALVPDWCGPHLLLGVLALPDKPNIEPSAAEKSGLEKEMREALRLHPGCPNACQALYTLCSDADRWKECREFLEQAHAALPDKSAVATFLASARYHCGDLQGATALLQALGDAGRDNPFVHQAFLDTAFHAGLVDESFRDLRLLKRLSVTDTNAANLLASVDASFFVKRKGQTLQLTQRPRSYSSEELAAELRRRLTPKELLEVVNPLEISPDIVTVAKQVTGGLTNRALRAILLFQETTRRGHGRGNGGIRTAPQALHHSQDPEARLSCQEYAKLFVALARAAGLEAWMVHIDKAEGGIVAFHDCAALFLDDQAFLVDPTWKVFCIEHQEFRVMDDLQAIAHQAMQPGEGSKLARLWIGPKLDPDDVWTRLQLANGLAHAGLPDEAEAQLARLGPIQTNRWDYFLARATIAASRKQYESALNALQQALAFSPSNAVVNLQLANLYLLLGQLDKSRQYADAAARLDQTEAQAGAAADTRFALDFYGAFAQVRSGAADDRRAIQVRAEAGDVAAQLALAKLLLESKSPEPGEGLKWLGKAAEQGNSEAQRLYAFSLLAFRGPTTAQQARTWYTRSAEQGNQEAQLRLGLLLYDGKFLPRDEVTACQWIILAAESGNKEARSVLREMELFLDKSQVAEAKRRAAQFKPKARGAP
jgi:TPR repeat protein